MTAIAGFVHNNEVWIGGDSAGVGGDYSLVVRRDEKVFRKGEFLIGFTSSFRMGNLLRYKFQPPQRNADQDVYEYMVTSFVDALRQCFKDGGFAKKENEVERGGVFLVGYMGRLFQIEGDYQVGEAADGYDAVGCGDSIVIGALHATAGLDDPEARMKIALGAAECHSAGVRGPFHIEHLPATV
jgi:ATP-dependent protease HslVU (ClpYQ) peptidase subunit